MAKPSTTGVKQTIKHIVKLTKQGGNRVKTSAMNKNEKSSYKRYRGQGK